MLQKVGDKGVSSGGGSGPFDKEFVSRSTAPKSVSSSVLDDEWKARVLATPNGSV